jgi:hypothetical protein
LKFCVDFRKFNVETSLHVAFYIWGLYLFEWIFKISTYFNRIRISRQNCLCVGCEAIWCKKMDHPLIRG